MKRFKVNKDDTITDTKTGLMWQKQFTNPLSWAQAVDYAKKLNLAGHSDWRLPTIKELITLIDFGKYEPVTGFPEMSPDYFWSSSSYAPHSGFAWVVDFYNGKGDPVDKDCDLYVRCVRG